MNDDQSKNSMKCSKISEINGLNNFIFQMQQKEKIQMQNNSQIGNKEM